MSAALGIAATMFANSASGEAFIVKNGKPFSEIIIAEKPARMTKLAASELQAYLEKITGARLAVTNAPDKNIPVKIYVGKSKYTDDLKLSTDGLAHGAFRMVSGENWLSLLGPDGEFVPLEPYPHDKADVARAKKDWDALNPGDYYAYPYSGLHGSCHTNLNVWSQDNAGTLNAVYEFLRSLGVRWYFPGEIGEIVQKKETVALPALDKTVQPDFPLRMFSFWRGGKDITLWQMRMGCNVGSDLIGNTQLCHGSKWIYMRDEVKKAHPDWYALWDGQRATNHSYSGAPCLSSEGLFKQQLKFARFMFDVRKEPMLSLDVCDGYGSAMCGCELCRGLDTPDRGRDGSMSDYVFGYVNRAAAQLYKSNPDRKVSGLSYSAYKLPPEKIDKLSPNLAIWLCQWRSDYHDPAARDAARVLRQAWLDKLPSREIFIYDYYLHSSKRYGYEGLPVYFPRLVAEDLQALKGASQGEQIEIYMHSDPSKFTWNPLAVMHLNIYATARLWWDADLDLDALLDEFYTLFYGPAAKQMKAFIEFSEANWPLMKIKAEPIDEAMKLLSAARAAPPPDSIYSRRIDLVADYVKPLSLLRDRLAKKRENAPKARVLPVFTLSKKKLDGRLDDEKYWPNARTLQMYDLETGKWPKKGQGTSVRIFRDSAALYFGIRCGEPDITNLNRNATQAGSTDIRQGDFVEILLETPSHSYYRITVNPAGALEDADCAGGVEPQWSSGAAAAVHVGEDYWSVEVRVPVAGENARTIDPLIGVSGNMPTQLFPWYFNVVRQRARNGIVERLAFFPTGTNVFEVPGKFAEMWSK